MAAGLRTAVLMCHAPIVIPALGRRDSERCRSTTAAMAEAARRVVAGGAGRVVVLSPHAPRRPRAYGCYAGPGLAGDFARFGEPGLAAGFAADPEAAAAAAGQGLDLAPIQGGLDHGALVPLWFLREAGFAGRVSVFGFPWEAPPGGHAPFGAGLRAALDGLGVPWALVASGDCSHRLLPGAPAGYDPRAGDFDGRLVAAVRAGREAAVAEQVGPLRGAAAEDVVDSLEAAAGAAAGAGGGPAEGREVLSYEGPFGVGYLVAVLRDGPC